MAVSAGARLGPYEIVAAIGAGGMGEVYRARDTKLGRDVAMKVLPDGFANDASRMARFGREAKLLAALDHPNIASIYGLEDSANTRALVMQLAEGPTLADKIRQGPLSIEDVLKIARQICDALEYAHERGIIHRDLKPANVKVAADDTVKILDFGLAKAMENEAASVDISTSPTISRMATEQGILLGTAAYMAPEQAKGKPVDRRADIWAFGCVLYEMLTGKMAFPGETATDVLASVLRNEPDFSKLPAPTPIRVRVLLQRCLQKDPKQRLRDIGDARISLDEVLAGAPEGAAALTALMPLWRRALPWAVGILGIAFAISAWILWHPTSTPVAGEAMRFQIALPEGTAVASTGSFALSPDGHELAFAGTGPDGVLRIWVHSLDSLEVRPLLGSESPNFPPFFWSPDSQFIAFDAGGKLKKIPISGGAAQTICDVTDIAVGGSWNRDGVIIFGANSGGLMRVSANGGLPTPLTDPDSKRGEIRDALPSFLPDGRHFTYKRVTRDPDTSGAYIGSLDLKPEEQSRKRLVPTPFATFYVPSADPASGQLLFMNDGALRAQRFDTRSLELSGEPTTLAEGIGAFLDYGFFSVSNNGILAYRTGGVSNQQQLTWYDRKGKVLGTTGEPGVVNLGVALSPDGIQAATSNVDLQTHLPVVWLLNILRGTSSRLTFGLSPAQGPVWSPDGRNIIFASNRVGHIELYEKSADGATDEHLLLHSDDNKFPSSWSRDGRYLLYTAVKSKTNNALWILPLGGDKKPFPFATTEFNEQNGQFSPDGRWIAYSSDESGRLEVYVRPFLPGSSENGSGVGGKWLISNAGGDQPRWRGDGKELYYLAADGKLMAVEVTTQPAFQASVPNALFQSLPLSAVGLDPQWDVTADGKRFLFAAPTAQSGQIPFTVVSSWQAALKK